MSLEFSMRSPVTLTQALTAAVRMIGRALKWAFVAAWVGVGLIIAITLCHRYLNFCPIHLKSFADDAVVPVLYGHVWSFGGGIRDDIQAGAERGEYVIAGSCIPLGYSHVCPLCHWPARFESPDEVQNRISDADSESFPVFPGGPMTRSGRE